MKSGGARAPKTTSAPRLARRTPHVIESAGGPARTGGPWAYVFQMSHMVCGPAYRCERDKFFGHQIMFMARGNGHGTYQGRPWKAGPGTAVLMDLNRPHTYYTDPDDPWEMYWVIMEGPGIARIFSTLIESAGSPAIPCPDMKGVALTFRKLFRLLNGPQVAGEAWVARELSTLLALVEDGVRRDARPVLPSNQAQAPVQPIRQEIRPVVPLEGISAARSFLQLNHQRPLSLDEIARSAHMSRFHFIRQFKRELGATPMEFLEQFRIGRAQELMLEQPNLRLNDVARAVGFEDPAYFSRVFHKRTGYAPRDYRRNFKA